MSIKAFIFDYGNVISTVDTSSFVKSVRPYAVGTASGEERMERAKELMVAYESGRVTTDDFVPAFLDRTGLRMETEEFVRQWSSFFTPIPFTRSLVRELKGRYRLGLLSNTNPLHFEHVIAKTDVYPLFEAVTLSYKAGAMKPDPALYYDMLAKLGIDPATCVYLDDVRSYVDAAAALGMAAIHVTTPQEVAGRIHQMLPDLKLPSA